MTVTWKPTSVGQSAQGHRSVGSPDDQEAGRRAKRLHVNLRLFPFVGQRDYLSSSDLQKLFSLVGYVAVQGRRYRADGPAGIQYDQLAAKHGLRGEPNCVNCCLVVLYTATQGIPLRIRGKGLDQDVDGASAAQAYLEPHFVGYAVVGDLGLAGVQDLHRALEYIGLDTTAAYRTGHASAAGYAQTCAGRSWG